MIYAPKDLIQGSPEWFLIHGSVPSASCFDKIITTKGAPSKQRDDYMLQLAGTRVFHVYEEGYTSWSMQQGIEREAAAKELYQVVTGNELHDTGFCYYDERMDRGCSPDSLVNDDMVLEVKSPMLKTHVRYIINGVFPMDYYQQVQGELYITWRKSAHFMSFFPGAPPFIIEVKRDERFIEMLDKELDQFNRDLNELVERLKATQ